VTVHITVFKIHTSSGKVMLKPKIVLFVGLFSIQNSLCIDVVLELEITERFCNSIQKMDLTVHHLISCLKFGIASYLNILREYKVSVDHFLAQLCWDANTAYLNQIRVLLKFKLMSS
jgi:hypothetical protein